MVSGVERRGSRYCWVYTMRLELRSLWKAYLPVWRGSTHHGIDEGLFRSITYARSLLSGVGARLSDGHFLYAI